MKYEVTIPYPVFVTVIVDADSEEEAIDIAYGYESPTQKIGNGGFDKLVGVDEENMSIEPGEEPITVSPFKTHVNKIE